MLEMTGSAPADDVGFAADDGSVSAILRALQPCSVPMFARGLWRGLSWIGQAARWYWLSTPPRSCLRRTGVSMATTVVGRSWVGAG